MRTIGLVVACGLASCGGGNGSGTNNDGGIVLPLTGQVLSENPCWEKLFKEIYACMESTVPDVAVVEGFWTPDGTRCNDTRVSAHYLTFSPAAPKGALSDWIRNRTITFWNAGVECGTLKFTSGTIITVSSGGKTAETETRSTASLNPDTRYARMSCPDGTTYVASGPEAGGLLDRMPTRYGSINFQSSELLTIDPPGDRDTLDCTFPDP